MSIQFRFQFQFQFQFLIMILILFLFTAGCSTSDTAEPASENVIDDQNYLYDLPPRDDAGHATVVVEIPAGDNAKWEVDKATGHLVWERIGPDSLRVVPYLPYPANYGMVPRTLLPVEAGGDGDPIDIFLLGPGLQRGTVTTGRVIGVIKMIDRGEQDDKLIAVDTDSWFSNIHSMDELEVQYPGVTDILILFLENYKGQGIAEVTGVEDAAPAVQMLEEAIHFFEMHAKE